MDNEIDIWLNINPYHTDRKRAKAYSDGILQQLLKNTLNCSADLRLKKNHHGKPFVDEPVFFSHSNSRQLYAYVVTTCGEVAIDVEWQRADRPLDTLARRYFHPAEQQVITAVDGAEQVERFYQIWTRKEAWCKLEGGNLWTYLNKNIPMTDSLHLCDIQSIRGFSACLASEQPITRVRINSLGHP
jgi:phosphopantetheinyl transferase